MIPRLTRQEFIRRCIIQHGKTYGYDLVTYVNAHTNVEVFCHTCETYFMQEANIHMRGAGCPKCGDRRTASKLSSNTEDFIEKAEKVHKDAYDYSEIIYMNGKTKVIIGCRDCGLSFKQTPNAHLRGAGCPTCWKKFSRLMYRPFPTVLYYIKFKAPQGFLYKIGITLQRVGVGERFRKEWGIYCVVGSQLFSEGRLAYIFEHALHEKHQALRYVGPAILRSGGDSELYTQDVLQLDCMDTTSSVYLHKTIRKYGTRQVLVD